MSKPIDGTKLSQHGIFYMEGAGGLEEGREPEQQSGSATSERSASCFAFEEEKGDQWKGGGSTASAIKESRPTL